MKDYTHFCVGRLTIWIPKDIRKIIYELINEMDYEVSWTKRIEIRYIEPLFIKEFYGYIDNRLVLSCEYKELLNRLPVDMNFEKMYKDIETATFRQECHSIILPYHRF